jgi:hypothetical protein
MNTQWLPLLVAVSILGTVPASSDAEIPGSLKWKKRIGGSVGYHSPAIAKDGTIYMAGGRDRALLAGVSAAVLNDENVRKMSVE